MLFMPIMVTFPGLLSRRKVVRLHVNMPDFPGRCRSCAFACREIPAKDESPVPLRTFWGIILQRDIFQKYPHSFMLQICWGYSWDIACGTFHLQFQLTSGLGRMRSWIVRRRGLRNVVDWLLLIFSAGVRSAFLQLQWPTGYLRSITPSGRGEHYYAFESLLFSWPASWVECKPPFLKGEVSYAAKAAILLFERFNIL